MGRAQATTDHQVIRHWIETHEGHPSVVKATQGRRKNSAGLLRVDFDEPEDSLEEVSWDDFFDTFENNNLAFLFQDEKQSRFHKFVNRDSIDESDLAETSEEESSTASSTKSASGATRNASGGKSGASGGKKRQATPAEEEEAEEIDEEDLEDEEDADDDDDEDLDEDLDDEDEDEDEDDDADEDEDEDEDETPKRGKKG